MASLVPVSVLRTLLKLDATALPDADPYANLILEQASDHVRAAAGQPLWVAPSDPATANDAPRVALTITAWLAYRVFQNPTNLSRRTSGPISESYFDNGLVGLELTAAERDALGAYAGSSGGLWIQPLYSAETVSTSVFLFDNKAGDIDGSSILYADDIDAGAFG